MYDMAISQNRKTCLTGRPFHFDILGKGRRIFWWMTIHFHLHAYFFFPRLSKKRENLFSLLCTIISCILCCKMFIFTSCLSKVKVQRLPGQDLRFQIPLPPKKSKGRPLKTYLSTRDPQGRIRNGKGLPFPLTT